MGFVKLGLVALSGISYLAIALLLIIKGDGWLYWTGITMVSVAVLALVLVFFLITDWLYVN